MTEAEWMDIFGDNLNSIMQERGYTQGDLADETGLDQTTISRYINKRCIPTMRAVVNLAYTLDCNISDLIDFGDRIE